MTNTTKMSVDDVANRQFKEFRNWRILLIVSFLVLCFMGGFWHHFTEHLSLKYYKWLFSLPIGGIVAVIIAAFIKVKGDN